MAQLHLSVLLLLLLAIIQVALAELQIGRYKIVSAAKSAPPPSPLGINPQGPVSPVITGGIEQVWTVRKVEDRVYVISIEQEAGNYVLKNNDRDIIADIFPPQAKWHVAKHQDGFYTIELPSNIWPSRAIYLPNSAPGARPQLGIYETVPPPNFLWEFIPAEEMRYKGRGCVEIDLGEGDESKYRKNTIKSYAKFRLLSVDRRWGQNIKFILMMFDWIQTSAIFSYQMRLVPVTTAGRATQAYDILERSNNGQKTKYPESQTVAIPPFIRTGAK
ncbi:hypothetical protein MVEG_01149 [Podila verticillata NRRL 6337]|nr:hypothetical protein MVEG_01149 [Podila verticillata NRRL 6337]